MSREKDAGQGEGFLGRWSRLKQATQEPAAPAAPTADRVVPAAAPEAPAGARTAGTDAEQSAEQDAAKDLPPIDSLDRNSDFTAFMKPGVPAELRNSALRKLWRTDPVFANLDGLLEYGEDFTAPWKTGGVVATAYQVGKGMVQALASDSAQDKPDQSAESPDPTTNPAVPAAPTEADLAPTDSADAKVTGDDQAATPPPTPKDIG